MLGPTYTTQSAPLPQFPPNLAKAHFATSSRLLACLVTEGLIDAYTILHDSATDLQSDGSVTSCVVIDPAKATNPSRSWSWDGAVAVIRVSHFPIMQKPQEYPGMKIAFLDPADMIPPIYEVEEANGQKNMPEPKFSIGPARLCVADTLNLWRRVSSIIKVEPEIAQQIEMELLSSVQHQEYAYSHRKPIPSLSSPSFEWEQSVVEGHPVHPMHKSRHAVHPIPTLQPTTPLDNINLRCIALPRNHLLMRGPFEELLSPLTNYVLSSCRPLIPPHYVILPIHPVQLPNITLHFSKAIILPSTVFIPARALTSVRTVVLKDQSLLPAHSLKLALGVRITSALRTISPYSTFFGPGLSRDVIPKLTIDREVLWPEMEIASCVVDCEDPDVAKHCSCVVREALESENEDSMSSQRGERIIVCAALIEKCSNYDETSVVEKVWDLDTREKRSHSWKGMSSLLPLPPTIIPYVILIFRAFLPPCLHNGFAFEAHPQNVLARFDRVTGQLRGFVVRDFAGVRLHQETLEQSCGVKADALPGSATVAEEIAEVGPDTLIFRLITSFNCD
ncbi:IucC family-domain-containing protein [Jimgerdemannia flammicorona]|uniref:IucC family-domain-containing protein n=1 Tax=Jimgerdemannia flammicorona TaxID=994334 RepID=A0A433QGT6_9FUNG|nr:IucC family-domain-containing protein [Jimgerdemannia flammicorona]